MISHSHFISLSLIPCLSYSLPFSLSHCFCLPNIRTLYLSLSHSPFIYLSQIIYFVILVVSHSRERERESQSVCVFTCMRETHRASVSPSIYLSFFLPFKSLSLSLCLPLSITFNNDDMLVKRRKRRRVHTGVEEITKPVMIEDYNQYMGGVDLSNPMLQSYGY